MQEIEKKSFSQGQSPESLMEEVALCLAEKLAKEEKSYILLCGRGNNAADAYLAGKFLIQKGLKIEAFQMPGSLSPLCSKQQKAFLTTGGHVKNIEKSQDLFFSYPIIDALFGTGFHTKAEGLFQEAIKEANASKQKIYSIDIPSGLNGNNGESPGPVIKAFKTFSLGCPKLGCFLQNGFEHVGEIDNIPISLALENKEKRDLPIFLMQDDLIQKPNVLRRRHKYEAGYVCCVAGSPSMAGAAKLCTTAALRSGAGLVRLFHPKGMQSELSNSKAEIIQQEHQSPIVDTSLKEAIEKSSSLLIGPGLGRSFSTQLFVERLLKQKNKKMLLDADALYAMASRNLSPPQNSILTPHLGEAQTLFKEKLELSEEGLKKCLNYCKTHGCILVLKSSPIFVFFPEDKIYVHIGGNPGMATAGSGDVLSGILAALIASDLNLKQACIFGLKLHASAGDLALQDLGPQSLIASDLIDYLPLAFNKY